MGILRIYNSRNYQSLLAYLDKKWHLSPIYNSRNYQSLLANKAEGEAHTAIYNSRNYQSLLARKGRLWQTINLQQQKLLELTSQVAKACRALTIYNSRNYQSLLAFKPSSLCRSRIYNSRNYQSLLARDNMICPICQSTIVEIIRAYQPKQKHSSFHKHLQQQKLLELTSHKNRRNGKSKIYNSRNYQSLLAKVSRKATILYLQQQKLLELTSRPNFLVSFKYIYNSRNYQSLLAFLSRRSEI